MTDDATQTLCEGLPFDPLSEKFQADPYRHYRRLREQAPVIPGPHGLWFTTAYRPALEVLGDKRWNLIDDYTCLSIGAHYPSNAMASPAVQGPRLVLAPWRRDLAPEEAICVEREDRASWQQLVKEDLIKRVRQLEPRIRELVDELLDKAFEAGRLDLMESIATPLPLLVTCELLRVNSDERAVFLQQIMPLIRGLDPVFTLTAQEIEDRDRAGRVLGEYFRGQIVERRRHPGDDMLSALVALSDESDALGEQELTATCTLLFVAGFTTTAHFIGNAILALLQYPDELRRFRAEPELAPEAVEELLRYDAPAQFTIRTALEDIRLDGQLIPKGNLVIVLTASANRDPRVFPDPDRLDLKRPNSRQHLSFSHGLHTCLGAPLARMETRILFGAMMRRVSRLELTGEPKREKSFAMRAVATLPVAIN